MDEEDLRIHALNVEWLKQNGLAQNWACLSFGCQRVSSMELRDSWERLFQQNGGLTAEWSEGFGTEVYLYMAYFCWKGVVCIAVPIYATPSGLGMAQGIRRFSKTCPGVPLHSLGPYLLAETCRAMRLRYLALHPTFGFDHKLKVWAEEELELTSHGYVCISPKASVYNDLKAVHFCPWLSLGPPEEATGVMVTPLYVKGEFVGGLRPRPEPSQMGVFDEVEGRWLYPKALPQWTRDDLTQLGQRLAPSLWGHLFGTGIYLFDGPKVGTLSPLAPAFSRHLPLVSGASCAL